MATDHGPVTYESIEMTPELADEWIEKYNVHNRKSRDYHVRRIQRAIERGRYLEGGENGVTFDWDGNIAGGQHTLLAVRAAGRTVRMRLTKNVDPAVRDVLNDGLKEHLADRLTANNVRNSKTAEAVLRKALFYENIATTSPTHTGGLIGSGNAKYAKGDLMDEWVAYAEPIIGTLEATGEWDNKNIWPGNRGAMHFMWWLLVWRTKNNPEKVKEFFNRVAYGSQDETERDLFIQLKNRFKKYPTADYQVYWLLKAWRAWASSDVKEVLQSPRNSINPVTGKMTLVNANFPRPYRQR